MGRGGFQFSGRRRRSHRQKHGRVCGGGKGNEKRVGIEMEMEMEEMEMEGGLFGLRES